MLQTPEKKGWLQKKGARQNDGWQRRWFELKDHKLEYFERPSRAEAPLKKKGEIDLQTCTAVRESTGPDARPREFEVIVGSRTYRLESEEDDCDPGGRLSWVATLTASMTSTTGVDHSVAKHSNKPGREQVSKLLDGVRDMQCCATP